MDDFLRLDSRSLLFIVLIAGMSLFGFNTILGQSSEEVFGVWTTIDESSGKARSQVEIYEVDGKAFGKIVKFIDKPELEETQYCTKCPEADDRYGQLVMGMEIIRDLKFKKGKWEGGTVLDPENGKIYKCKIWLEDGKLKVRGYIAFFYRTQEWVKPG